MDSLTGRPKAAVAALAAAVLAGSLGAAPAPLRGNVPLAVAWDLTPAQIANRCTARLAAAKRRVAGIEATPAAARRFSNVVAGIEDVSAGLNDDLVAEGFLYNVSTDPKVRAASLRCNTDLGNVFNELQAQPAFYRALADAKASHTARGDAQTKLTDLWITASKRSGAALPAAKRAEFIALSKHLVDLQNRFGSNLAEDTTTIAITAQQASSLPADFVATLKQNADGTLSVPVNESTSPRFFQNEADAAARKTFYVAYARRGGEANVTLLQDAIATRDRLAHLLGYDTWAAYVLADRMAGTPQRVESFLHDIDVAILPKARAERAEDAALKGSPLDEWDVTYYENQLKKTKYAVDTNEVKQYFPVQHTVDAVLGIYQKLLGVRFTAAPQRPRWNPDVLAYDVTDDASATYVGTFYLDLYPRPGKYNHFANWPLVPRRVMPDGTVRAPMSAIIGNWPQPAPGKPALLSHADVETFFHEFGHCMAAILADEPYETLTSGFRQDFVEAPSQMLENWVWDPGVLKELSSNVTTGQPLPDDLITKMIAARYVHYALATTRQIVYAVADMRYHTMRPPVDTTAVWARTTSDVSPATFVPGTFPQAGFGHLMGGYDAGYYGYLWSKVYAQDMFTAFATAGLENPQVGMRYRRDILAPARTYEPDAEVRAFLGRPMNPDAFYRELGITPPATRAAR